jgi:hypothetical protein
MKKFIFVIVSFFFLAIATLFLITGNVFPAMAGSLMPDRYICSNDGCNRCQFDKVEIGPFAYYVGEGCTEIGCGLPITDKIHKTFKKCSKDWSYSKNIWFDDLSAEENKCINNYRNNQGKASENVIEKAFTICVDSNIP